MKKTYKKLWALLMSFMLVFTMMPAMAFAAEESSTEDAIKVYYLNEAEEEVVLPYETGANCQYHYGPPFVEPVELPCYTVEIPAGQSDLYLKYADFSVNKKPFFGTLSEGVIEEGSQITAAEFLEDAVKVPVGEFADAEEKYIAFYDVNINPAFVLKVTMAAEVEPDVYTAKVGEQEYEMTQISNAVVDVYFVSVPEGSDVSISNPYVTGYEDLSGFENCTIPTDDGIKIDHSAIPEDEMYPAEDLAEDYLADYGIELKEDGKVVEGLKWLVTRTSSGNTYLMVYIEYYPAEEDDSQTLATIKASAISELEGYKSMSDYREAQQAELATAIENGKDAINAAETEAAVAEALAAAKAEINKIKTAAELDAEEATKATVISPEISKLPDVTGIKIEGTKVKAFNVTQGINPNAFNLNIFTDEADSTTFTFQLKEGSKYKRFEGNKFKDIEPFSVNGFSTAQYVISLSGTFLGTRITVNFNVLSACNDPNGTAHTYDNGMVTKEATCKETGIKLYTCTCGVTKEETIPVTSHAWDAGALTKEATCYEAGVKTYTCTNMECRETKTETIPTVAHSWNDGKVIKAATCSEGGVSLFACMTEGCVETKFEYPAATGNHTWDNGKVTVKPTCINGLKTFTCTTCGGVKTEEIEATKAHTWNEGEVVKDASYFEQGQTKYTCTVCETTKTETDIPVIENPVFVEEAYYFDENGEKQTVSVKAETIYFDNFNGSGNYQAYTVTAPESVSNISIAFTELVRLNNYAQVCEKEEDGTITSTPGQIKFTVSERIGEIPVGEILGTGKYIYIGNVNANYAPFAFFTFEAEHVWDEGAVTTAPTCTEPGEKTFTCTYCAEIDEVVTTTEPIPSTGHDMNFNEAKAPTCTVDGNVAYYTCSVCEKNFADEAGKTMLDSVTDAAKGHKMTKTEAKAPTCTEAGNVAYYTCSVCEKNFADEAGKTKLDSVTDTAKGHKMTKTEAKAPTCTEAGNVAYYTCSVCEKNFADEAGKTKLDSVTDTAKGHKYASKVVTPTTEAEGYTTHTCGECGYTYRDAFVDKLPGQPADTPTDKPADTPTDEPTVEPDDQEPVVEKQQLKAPAKVKASNVAASGKIKLTWKKVDGADQYKVYRATSKNGKYTLMKTVKGTSYINKTAKAGKTYFYKVKAVSKDKNVKASAYSKIVKRTADLKKPVVTAKSKTKKQVKLTWKKVEGAKKYTVYRATSKNGKYKKIATTTKLTYTNKKLKSGKTYYYKVKAVAKNSAANSAFSTVDKCKAK